MKTIFYYLVLWCVVVTVERGDCDYNSSVIMMLAASLIF